MRATALSLVALLTVLTMLQSTVSAQTVDPSSSLPATTAARAPETPPSSDPFSSKGPAYSVDRVRRELRQVPATTSTEKRDGLRLEYYIQVFGTAPPIELFKGIDLKTGQVPFGAPTHQDMLDQMTPQQYRKPVGDIGSLMVWIAQQLAKKKK